MIKKSFSVLPEPSNDIKNVFSYKHEALQKVFSYYLTDLKNNNLNVMLVGAGDGQGLLSFVEFFNQSTVFAIEIDDKRAKTYNDLLISNPQLENVKITFGDSTVDYTWIVADNYYNVIVDKNSSPENQIKTLRRSWNYLRDKGVYIIESTSLEHGLERIDMLAREVYLMENACITNAECYYYQSGDQTKFITVLNKNRRERYATGSV